MATEKPTYLRRRKPGDIGQLKRVLWGCLIELESQVLWSEGSDTKIRAGHCLAQLSNSYLKALEVGDLVQRIEALEAAQGAGTVTPIRRVS